MPAIPHVRAAVVQVGSKAFDTAGTLKDLEARVSQAALAGGQIIVFPEAYVGGYPKGLDFGARVGTRSLEGRDWFARYADGAITLDGPEVKQLAKIAKNHNVVLVTGIIERMGHTLYCSTVTFDRRGNLVNLHRKTMPTAMERLIWGYGDGSTLDVVDTSVGRVGSVICWENYMPQLRLSQYAQGVELYCAPTVDDRANWQHTMHHIALEGRCFVLASCQYSVRADYPEDFNGSFGNNPDTVIIRGGSVIISPLGEILAGPIYDGEAILLADLDMADIDRGKYDLDVVGHYARPDIFTLSVNTSEQIPVQDTGVTFNPLEAPLNDD